VAIDGEALKALGSAVGTTKSMLLPGGEPRFGKTCVGCACLSGGHKRAVVVHLPIYEVVVRSRRRPSRSGHDLLHKVVVVSMVPVN